MNSRIDLNLPVKFTNKEILPKIFHLEFEEIIDLTSTFLRFQEYYESPEFRGKIFTLDEYKEWYIKIRGIFSYYTDWGGFNIPSYILKPFLEGKFNPLTAREKQILDEFRDRTEKYYIIGTYKSSKHQKSTLKHEIAHALFYINREYRDAILEALKEVNIDKFKSHLLDSGGYIEDVLFDEYQAYLLSNWKYFKNNFYCDSLELVRNKLESIFNKYSKKNKK